MMTCNLQNIIVNIVNDQNEVVKTLNFYEYVKETLYRDFKVALDNEEVPDGDPIGTGMIAKLIINKNEADRKILVVPGDSNGDAAVDIFDLLVMVDHILEATPLEGPYYEAGDYDRNVDLDIYDLLAVVDVIINS